MSSERLAIPADNCVLYFARDREILVFLSHFHAVPIILDGEMWPTVEHYYQAQKSLDLAYRQAIRAMVTPGLAKRLAAPPDAPRRVSSQSWFRKNGTKPRPDWHEVKLDIMRRGDLAKFTQNAYLAKLLLGTGNAELGEDSTSEPYWGVGPDNQGSNWAGRVIMEVREQLRAARSEDKALAEPGRCTGSTRMTTFRDA